MDKTILSVITALRSEKQRILDSLGDMPKADQFEHGVQVGTYRGLKSALEVIDGVLEDREAENANL
jgi:hypothetical protein